MPNFRRNRVPGGTYFFTVVTHERRPILTAPPARRSLRESLADVRGTLPYELFAVVLLPDHLHAVWVLPPDDDDYSTRWARIKEGFTRRYLDRGGEEGRTTPNREAHRERAVWQPRFWEYTVRDQDDLKRCVDYVHFNPVKHGLVTRVRDYPWSSFHEFVRRGEYEPDWGTLPPDEVPGAEWD